MDAKLRIYAKVCFSLLLGFQWASKVLDAEVRIYAMFHFAAVFAFLVGLEGFGSESANLCNLRPLEVGWVHPQRRTSVRL